jgi:pimeloyl-ACP methyl ester carboxylesterase
LSIAVPGRGDQYRDEEAHSATHADGAVLPRLVDASTIDTWRARIRAESTVRAALTRPDVRLVDTPTGPVRLREQGQSERTVVIACDPPNVIEHYDALFDIMAPTHRVICLEMPGFGFSRPAVGFGFGLPDYASTVMHLLDDLRVGPCTLAFPCVWGYVALRVAAERPELVAALALTQTPQWSDEVAWARRIDSYGLIRTPIAGQALMAVAPRPVADRWYRAALPRAEPALDRFTTPARAALSRGAMFCLASFTQAWFGGPAPTFAPVPHPGVIIWGGADRSHRYSGAESALQYLPRAHHLTMPDAGHFPDLEQPERFRDALTTIAAG